MVEKLATTLDLGATSKSEIELLKGDSPIKREINDIVKKVGLLLNKKLATTVEKKCLAFATHILSPLFV